MLLRAVLSRRAWVRVAVQQVFREVQTRVGKELRAGHAVEIHGPPVAALPNNSAEIPDGRPERG